MVGGIAGYYAGYHGLIGTAAGCVVGHHMANKHTTQQAQPSSAGSGTSQGYGSTAPTETANPPHSHVRLSK